MFLIALTLWSLNKNNTPFKQQHSDNTALSFSGMLCGNLCLFFASRTHVRTPASGCCRIQSWSIAWFDFWSALTDNYSTLWDECWSVLKKRCDWLMSRKGKASWSHFQCLINLGVADFPRCRGQGGVTILFLVVFVSVLLLLLSTMYDSSPQWQKAVLLLVRAVLPETATLYWLIYEFRCACSVLPRAQTFKSLSRSLAHIYLP